MLYVIRRKNRSSFVNSYLLVKKYFFMPMRTLSFLHFIENHLMPIMRLSVLFAISFYTHHVCGVHLRLFSRVISLASVVAKYLLRYNRLTLKRQELYVLSVLYINASFYVPYTHTFGHLWLYFYSGVSASMLMSLVGGRGLSELTVVTEKCKILVWPALLTIPRIYYYLTP